jgi:hypothetical protein
MRVIPIWTLARKSLGLLASSGAIRADLLPCSASASRRARRAETTAISAIAKMPFATASRTIAMISMGIYECRGTGSGVVSFGERWTDHSEAYQGWRAARRAYRIEFVEWVIESSYSG